MEQEQLMQLQIIEQESQQLEQQSQLIDQHLAEMQELNLSLEELESTDKKEILANLGRGIYIPAEIKDKMLTVEVGHKIFVKKTIPETKKIVEEQIKKLSQVKQQIFDRIDSLRDEVNFLMEKKGNKKEKTDVEDEEE